jgi:predicted GNAT family acetyltransferase
MDNDLLDKIIFVEHNFPKLFSKMECSDYGILFFNEEINISHDSNHAILKDDIPYDYEQAIDKITVFYESKGIIPRIYSSLNYGQIAKLEKTLLLKRFHVEKYSNNYWVIHKQKCSINDSSTLKIERIDNDQKLQTMVNFYDDDWNFPLLNKKIRNNHYHFFTGYEKNIPVSIGAIQYIEGIGRIDDIETKITHRGKGYSRQMLRYLVKYHQDICNNILYLWYNNPIAGKIYREAGFIDFENNFESWSAYKKDSE